MNASFEIKTQVFQGPLDLLLSLIEKRKLSISDITLAQVTDNYLAHLQQFEQFPIADSADFILIASTLLLIKSRSLLPSLPLTEEEQGSIEQLEMRLKIYKRMKELSIGVSSIFGKHIIFPRSFVEPTAVFSPGPTLSSSTILESITNALKALPRKEVLPQTVVKKIISLEEMIERLTTRVKSSLKMSFNSFAGMGKEEKVNVIVGFLAMLELVKQGIVNVAQHERHGDIEIETDQVGVPNYS
jgi:segregation and condensation protein A